MLQVIRCGLISHDVILPRDFIDTTYRILGKSASPSHDGSVSCSFAYKIQGGGAALVTWGELAKAARKLPGLEITAPQPDFRLRGDALLKIKHITPTKLKKWGGSKIAWFDPEAYLRAMKGVTKITGRDDFPVDRVKFIKMRTDVRTWNLGCGFEEGFVGEIVITIPAAWARVLKVAGLTGIGQKRSWGMGNVEVARVG
ncbi:CRISPR system precrRNA processing endoribonuclease RAMP protein Cas6 [Moorella naiadis]|uniref:CRISPR system precrRNA processing endoribonuclease RAMP protein Cas6 n=1 Tax=Moorella naiadis (nom. illeg.) TaxID=3093670 RepID=UPI003D9CA3FD